MRTLQVRYSMRASQDLQKEFDYIVSASGSTQTATQYISRIKQRCEALGFAPLVGSDFSSLQRNIRSAPFERRAQIFYRVEEAQVLITRVYFNGQNYPNRRR